ncbi:MAG: signal recognition particle protein [Mycoplasmatales bacterium]
MLDILGNKIQNKLDDLGRQTKIEEADIKQVIKDIRMILLESDVNYKVAKEFCQEIEQKALNQEILKGLKPSDQIMKIVKDELLALLQGDNELKFTTNNIILMVGLQGAGKTTTTGKIANFLRKKKIKHNPLLVACDIYRPAAIDQLHVIGKQLNIEVYSEKDNQDVNNIVKNALKFAQEHNHDLIILDTAGRLHIDENLMEEVKTLQDNYQPTETLLVLDSTVGQIATDVANSFKEYVNITGLVFTKMDGDSRGGGLLSVKKVTGADIKLLGISEKMDGIELFNPERVVSRILGQGDVLGLIEKAEEFTNEEEANDMANKMLEGKFDLNDFLKQMKMVKKMGGITSLLGMIPGMKKIDTSMINEDELKKIQSIIESMTDK